MRGLKKIFRWQTTKLTDYQLFLKSAELPDCKETRHAYRVAREAFELTKDYYPSDKRTFRQILLDNMMVEEGIF